jgi:hypothetical protein
MKWNEVIKLVAKKDIKSKLDEKNSAGDLFDLSIKSIFFSNKQKFSEKYSKYFDETETEESLKQKADFIAKKLIELKKNNQNKQVLYAFEKICKELNIKFLDANYILYKYMTKKDDSYEEVSLDTWRNHFLYSEAISVVSNILLLYSDQKLNEIKSEFAPDNDSWTGRFSKHQWKLTEHCEDWNIFPECPGCFSGIAHCCNTRW